MPIFLTKRERLILQDFERLAGLNTQSTPKKKSKPKKKSPVRKKLEPWRNIFISATEDDIDNQIVGGTGDDYLDTIRSTLKKLARKFPYRDQKTGYLYKKPTDKNKLFGEATFVFLIYDADKGHSVLKINTSKPWRMNYKDWAKWYKSDGFNIFDTRVIAAMNVKYGSEYEIKRLIGFHPKGK